MHRTRLGYNFFGSAQAQHEEKVLYGLAASKGVYQGPARRVSGPAQFGRIAKGDVLVTEETQKIFGPEVEVRVQGLSALVDNIVLLEYMDVGTALKRFLSIVKQRGSNHENHVRELLITGRGIELAPDPSSASAIFADEIRMRRRPTI